MAKDVLLHYMLDKSASRYPARTAVEDLTGRSLNYQEVWELAKRLSAYLRDQGVAVGDRVGICLNKSIDSFVAVFGILKCGAAYVPVDPTAPDSRNAYVFNNCKIKHLIIEASSADSLLAEMDTRGNRPKVLKLDSVGGGAGLQRALAGISLPQTPVTGDIALSAESLAYILYTSGSTGKPKGVMISHASSWAYINWCAETFDISCNDRFSSHAPFHFDLSILDIYVPIMHGATVVLFDEKEGKDPAVLAAAVSEKTISVWYSTPSILSLMLQYGGLADRDYASLRYVLFAGEVFPIKHLRALKSIWTHPTFYNLYGPTETNVCTSYEVPSVVADDRTDPYPIGKTCSHYVARVVDENSVEVARGTEGELCMKGPSVMTGYWRLDELSQNAFLSGEDGWYKTGDLVFENADGDFVYVGRRDRMVKKRGYRVELGEIEACLYRHDAIQEAAVVASADEESGVKIKAFVSSHSGERISVIKLKKFCTENLPSYMVPDVFVTIDELPKTSTDKVDYQQLMGMN